MQDPRFSIIMPAYNDGDYIGEAIESVLGQTYQSFELIIVDDGSTDNTPEALLRYREHPKVKTIRQRNGGTAAARNTGLGLASGEFIGFLDSDDFYTPDRLAAMNGFLEENQDVHCAATDHAIWDGERLTGRGHNRQNGSILTLEDQLVFCTLVIRADVINELGFFDPRFYYIEDVEMRYRLHAYGYPIYFADDCTYYYRRHGDVNKTSATNANGIQKDVIKIDMKYMLSIKTPIGMRLQCLRWLIGNIRRYA